MREGHDYEAEMWPADVKYLADTGCEPASWHKPIEPKLQGQLRQLAKLISDNIH